MEELGKKLAGTNPAFMITFKSGIRAIFKPDRDPSYQSSIFEVDAYRAARLVSSRQVPPTVQRTIEGKQGSVQYFVDSSIDLLDGSEKSKNAYFYISEKNMSDQKLFYFIFGQWDANQGNTIIDDTYTPALIDNEAISARLKVRYGESAFRMQFPILESARVSQESDTFPFDQAHILKNPTEQELALFLKGTVDPKRIPGFWKWRKNNKDKTMALVQWRGHIWVQGIGFHNYGSKSRTNVYSKSTLDQYRALTFEKLRETLSTHLSNEHIYEILERRDQVLRASESGRMIP